MGSRASGTSIVAALAARLEVDEAAAEVRGGEVWSALHATVVEGRRVVVPGIGSFELAFGGFSCTIDDDLRASLHGAKPERPEVGNAKDGFPEELSDRLGDRGLQDLVRTLEVVSETLWSTGSAMIPGSVVITAGLRSHPLLPNAPGTPQIEITAL